MVAVQAIEAPQHACLETFVNIVILHLGDFTIAGKWEV